MRSNSIFIPMCIVILSSELGSPIYPQGKPPVLSVGVRNCELNILPITSLCTQRYSPNFPTKRKENFTACTFFSWVLVNLLQASS